MQLSIQTSKSANVWEEFVMIPQISACVEAKGGHQNPASATGTLASSLQMQLGDHPHPHTLIEGGATKQPHLVSVPTESRDGLLCEGTLHQHLQASSHPHGLLLLAVGVRHLPADGQPAD